MLNINFEAVYLIKLHFTGAIFHKYNTSTAYGYSDYNIYIHLVRLWVVIF